MGTLTAVLETLQSPQPSALPDSLARLMEDYWQARPVRQALVELDAQVVRSAPGLGKLLADLRREASSEPDRKKHQGSLTAGLLMAVWVGAVRGPRLKGEASLDEWIEVLLPVSRYLEPALYGERQRKGPEALARLKDVNWVKGWVGDSALARQIADYAAEAQTMSRHWFQDRRRRGVEHLLTGIQAVLGQGPLSPGSIIQLLPALGPAPDADRLPAPGTVTLSFGAGPQPTALPPLPLDYVTRAELPALVGQLTSAPGATRAIILSGITGAGKTTLAAGLAREPAVVAAFRDGILWPKADQGDVLAELCQQAGLVNRENPAWSERWWQWAGEPTRRALVILDDVVDAALLAPVAGGLGPQMALVVTTQFGDAVATELARWLPAATIQRRDVTGLSQGDARALFEHILGRALAAEEVERVAEVGELLGWHAGALVCAAAQARDYGWDGLLAGLREGGLPADRLRRMVQRQWERLAGEQRADLAALLRCARGRGPFGLPYAMAAWNVKHAARAEMRLAQLARAGLIERLQARPDDLYLSPTLWRIAPVVAEALREMNAVEFMAGVPRALCRLRLAGRLQSHARSPLRVPWQFALIQTAWWLVWGGLRQLLDLLFWPVGRGREWYQRWLLWTMPGVAAEQLQARWRRLGLEPSQELWLIYEARAWQAALGLAVLLLVLLLRPSVGVTLPEGVAVVGGLLLAGGLIYWLLRPGVWRTWLAYLYGVDTWDLRLTVRLCRRLGMREPVRVGDASLLS